MQMPLYGALFWLILIVAFCVLEGMTFALVCIWFAGGAVAALFASLLGAGQLAQYAVFVVASALLLTLTRPLVKRHFSGRKVRTNSDRVIGEAGVVIKAVDPVAGTGQIKVLGQIWSAKPDDGVSAIAEGLSVVVVGISGVKVSVREKV
ncbi:MAG: NfeD family protein [Clostridiales bacterium]|jgi:membrane protein implicated in regulation of membrane protease activity|nr:NfeD family protein [Clostridiales bacterium]